MAHQDNYEIARHDYQAATWNRVAADSSLLHTCMYKPLWIASNLRSDNFKVLSVSSSCYEYPNSSQAELQLKWIPCIEKTTTYVKEPSEWSKHIN